jgi:hypothetical protein
MAAADLVRLDAQLAPLLALVSTLAPADPALTAVQNSLTTLRPFLDGSAPNRPPGDAVVAQDAFVAALRAFFDRWKGELARAVLGGLPELPAIRDLVSGADWLSPDGIDAHATLGPVTLRAGFDAVVIPSDARVAAGAVSLPPLALGPSRLDRVGATLAGPVPGDGMLRVLADGFSGALRVPMGPVTVDALASLRRTPSGGPSFLGVMGVGFTPAIQLSFGFALDRVGGVVGVERRVDVDALTRGIRDGSATAALFGASGADTARRLVAIEALFPPAAGRHVVGPMLGLAWLSAGAGTSLVHADVAVLVQLGGPVTVAIVGKGRLELSELLRMQVDLAGSIDAAHGRVAVDVSIVEARVLGAFRLTGDAAFRLATHDGGGVVFSAGGFYPGFDPRPIEIGPLRRLGFSTDVPTPGLDIRVEGYFAATSNTLQLGGRLELVFDAAAIVARGSIGLDALAQLRPFHFHANISGEVSVEALGLTFCGVRVDAAVDGPGPMSVNARLTVETFLKDIHWNETFSFGTGTADRAGRATSLVTVLADSARTLPLLRGEGEDHEVALEPRPPLGTEVVLLPRGQLAWVQRVSPLNVRCDRLQGEPLVPAGQEVRASVVGPQAFADGDVPEPFAPGAYLTLPENMALHVSAFEPQVAGLRVRFAPEPTTPVAQPPAVDVIVIRPGQAELTGRVATSLALAWSRRLADVGLAAPQVWTSTPAVTTKPETWHTADGVPHERLTAAWQHARHHAGGLPIHAADPVLDPGVV